MTFDEIAEEVKVITNRPDLVAETASAIKAATLKAHQSDFYSKDIYETGMQFPEYDYRQSLDFITLFANFRAIKYVRIVEDEFDTFGIPVEIVKVEALLDSYGQPRTNIAYVAGRVLEIRSDRPFKYLLTGCYVFPTTTASGYRSWVAEQYPWAIVYEAARVVFKMCGLSEEANNMRELVAEQYDSLKKASITDVGF